MSVENDPLIELRLSFRATVEEAAALVDKYGGTKQDVLVFLQTCAARILKQAAESPAAEDKEPTYAERKVAATEVMRQFGEKARNVGIPRRDFCELAEAMRKLAVNSYDEVKFRNDLTTLESA
jgi:phage gpG-like protein